jgi:hypothetical protein
MKKLISAGEGYIRSDYIDPQCLDGIPSWEGYLVYPHRYPDRIFRLSKDWTIERWSLDGIQRNTIPVGSEITADDTVDGQPLAGIDGGRWWITVPNGEEG